MPLEAHEEIEFIEPEMRKLAEVLILRAAIFQALEKWEIMQAIAAQLCRRQPDEPDWFLKFATATRRAVGLQEALAVLVTVANRFPTCATVLYNLACYAAQLGRLDSARARLAEAIKLEPACRKLALTDPDLAALRRNLVILRQVFRSRRNSTGSPRGGGGKAAEMSKKRQRNDRCG